MSSTNVYALTIHADYTCLHSGACCVADWDVPVELPVYRTLADAVANGQLRPRSSSDGRDVLITGRDLPHGAAAMLGKTDSGECVFFEAGTRLCVVHRDMGEEALPSTCRHFPRLALTDCRGTFITLSHFCPTAASLLFREDRRLAIVSSPPSFPPSEYEGLVVANDDLPPLLSPAMLMDYPGYSSWERHMVARCAEIDREPESIVATLERDARILRGWKPGGSSLAEAVHGLPPEFVAGSPPESLHRSLVMFANVVAAVPDDLKPPLDEQDLERAHTEYVRPAWSGFHGPLNRYLGARAFAAWTAYQGRGVATIVGGLDAALAVVRVEAARQCRDARRQLDAPLLLEAVRRADFILNHLAVRERLAAIWSEAEHSERHPHSGRR
jgi:Fe-S-cluster containining protein